MNNERGGEGEPLPYGIRVVGKRKTMSIAMQCTMMTYGQR